MGESSAWCATAHSNIALIKYWGKRDEALILPTTSSLSLTLDAYWTTTKVALQSEATLHAEQQARQSHGDRPNGRAPGRQSTNTDLIEGTEDIVTLDGVTLTGAAWQRVSALLDLIRDISGVRAPAIVQSQNHVPTAAGLASSASAFAALAAAAAKAYGLELSAQELSRIARRGSGSASRSIFGGFAMWRRGHDDESSYAEAVESPLLNDVAMVAAVVNSRPKAISSREGMRRTVATSPLYAAWVTQHEYDLGAALDALRTGDFAALGEVTEANALGMHATMHTARPPVMYWQPSTLDVLDVVWELRERGVPAWATIDAGPNVKVLCLRKDEQLVQTAIRDVPGVASCDIAHAGSGVNVERVECND